MEITLFIMTLLVGWFLGVTTMGVALVIFVRKEDKKRIARRDPEAMPNSRRVGPNPFI